jgi:hypothetical protein
MAAMPVPRNRSNDGNADPLAAQVADAVEQLLSQGSSVVLTTDTKDGKTVVKIESAEEQPDPDASKVRIETPNGHLDLDPDDPLAQAKLALEGVSANIAALKAL